MWLPSGTWQRIADKAYELYGHHRPAKAAPCQEWIDAENIVMRESHEVH